MSADDRAQSGPSDPPPGNGAPDEEPPVHGQPPREDEVSLLDILLVLARHKTLIVRTVLVLMLLEVTYALLALEKFAAEVRVRVNIDYVRLISLGKLLW
jgi:LPS O-antigen subunit length determinant protein (WzzB/FepE family)